MGCGGSDQRDEAALHVTPRVVQPGATIVAEVAAPPSAPKTLMAGSNTTIEQTQPRESQPEYYLSSAKGRGSSRLVSTRDVGEAGVGLSLPSHQRLQIPKALPAGTYRVAKEV